MKKKLWRMLQWLKRCHSKKKQATALLLMLALLVSGSVAWTMCSPATALAEESDEEDSGDSGEVTLTKEPTVDKQKYIKYNGDGTYDLTLNVSGTTGKKPNKAQLVMPREKTGWLQSIRGLETWSIP